jgi:archaellum biogenesis ATPase FlaH
MIQSNFLPMSILDKFLAKQTTDEMMEKIQDAEFCYGEQIPKGHSIAVVAPANTGKSAWAIHASAEMAKSGYQVIYINADASASDLKFYHNHARTNGYTLISPDLSNQSTDDIVNLLKEMARSEDDLNNLVIVIDTIKKFVDVIQKSQAKAFFKILRSLTVKGITVICLGHTNKHQDHSGKAIYEGTADLRNDVDELYYMEANKQPDGSLKASIYMDKCRAEVKNMTFTIRGKDRTVTIDDEFYDVKAKKSYEDQLKKDQQLINFINKSLAIKGRSTTELEGLSKTLGSNFTRRQLDKVLRTYSMTEKPLWVSEPAPKNGLIYSLASKSAVPLQSIKVC